MICFTELFKALLSKIHLILIIIIGFSNVYSQEKSNDSILNIVDTYISEDNKEEALKIAIAQLEDVTNNKSIPLQIKWNSKIGQLFSKNDNYQIALAYYNTAKDLSLTTKDSLVIATVYFDIGSLNLTEYTKISYREQKIDVALDKREAAFENFNYILTNFKNVNNIEEIFAKIYGNLTGMYSYTSNFDLAEAAGIKAIEYYKKINDTISVIGVKINIGVTQIYQEKYDEAEQNYLEMLPRLKDTTDIKILQYKQINYANLAHVYGIKNQHKKANNYLSLSHQLDMLYLERTSNKTLEEIEAKHNENKARQEEIAKTNIEIEKKEKTQLLFGVSGIITVLLLLLAAVLYRNSKLKSKSLELRLIQKELQQQQQLQDLREQTQSKVIVATLNGKLKERKYIAQTLHDSVSALLSSANMHLQVVKKKSNTPIEELEKSQRIINEASDKVRDLSHKLISAVLIKFGIEIAVKDLCEKYSNQDLTFEFINSTTIPRFEQDFEIIVHNIIQTLINNIIKHSKATLSTVEVNHNNAILKIIVNDNGIGFDTNMVSKKSGIGLELIKSRILTLNGNLDINSTSKGTKIKIELPTTYVS
jgi:signal transduction histidine kinase